jgi:glycosyltransferase involved in cell wall biosynthesis
MAESNGGRPVAAGKILICVTEDWFALSHFKPLIRALVAIAREVVVVTRSSGRVDEITALGARVTEFDFQRSSVNPAAEWATAGRLAALFRTEQPDAVHLIALKPIVLGGLAALRVNVPRVGVHMTGLGLLAVQTSPKAAVVRRIALTVVASLLRRPSTHLFVENRDDLATLRRRAADPGHRVTILGGAGVDPDYFTAQSPPANAIPIAAYVGRMIMTKGVDILLAAQLDVAAQGVPLAIELYGKIDDGNPEAILPDQIAAWEKAGRARWFGHVTDVRTVWDHADIFVMAPRGGEGLPRALLEAAASGRPLVVTDVPGCREFVRDGVEGFVVPPQNHARLAAALATLAQDAPLRARMGAAARARLLEGFTEAHVMAAIQQAYRQHPA